MFITSKILGYFKQLVPDNTHTYLIDDSDIYDKTKYIGKMIKGDEFNKIYSDTKFIKLLNRKDKFKTGLNIYCDEIDSLGAYISCDNNGILFTDIVNAPLWIYKNTKDVL